MSIVSVTSAQLSQLADIAKRSLPNESCAFLLGKNSGGESVVLEVMPMRNAESSPVSFSINPEELLRAYNVAEEKGHDVIGIFHSHPGRPSPSSTDIRFMELNPVVWVIYSTTENEFEAFINDVDVREVVIKIRD